MLTRAEINAAPNTLGEVEIAMIVSLLRNSPRYKANPALFSTLEDRLLSVDGTVKAQQINAMLLKIEELGIGEVAIRGGDDALYYSQTQEREAMLNYIISVLYSVSEGFIIIGGTDGVQLINTSYKTGQRELESDLY